MRQIIDTPAMFSDLPLPDAELLWHPAWLPAAEADANYRHALPRSKRPMAGRINLTFRKILS